MCTDVCSMYMYKYVCSDTLFRPRFREHGLPDLSNSKFKLMGISAKGKSAKIANSVYERTERPI